jgi:hypothetical protein
LPYLQAWLLANNLPTLETIGISLAAAIGALSTEQPKGA